MRIRFRTFLHPRRRKDLPVLPPSLVEVEEGKAGEIPRTHIERVGRIDRRRTRKVAAVSPLIVLHADWSGNLALKGVENRRSRSPLIDRSESVEIPIVVVPERARLVAVARWACGCRSMSFVQGRVINARPCLQKITDSCSLLLGAERWFVVVDPQRFYRLLKVDLLTFDGIADQRAEKTFAHRGKPRLRGCVAPFRDDHPMAHNHHSDRADLP